MGLELKLIIIFAAVLIVPALISSWVQLRRDKRAGCPRKCEGCEHYGEDGKCALGISAKGFAALYHKDKNKYE